MRRVAGTVAAVPEAGAATDQALYLLPSTGSGPAALMEHAWIGRARPDFEPSRSDVAETAHQVYDCLGFERIASATRRHRPEPRVGFKRLGR
jgi:hypothetical protein